ncbi:MAG: Histidine kinase-, DNA gyrase B-, and [Parcubacteria group bacterium GW2011_GWF2_38_8]|nr:MAG: Histidine kinase-, DNA gyrase B-, and [Parcubacteria group bacterium GW2011_GWF2_38_8]
MFNQIMCSDAIPGFLNFFDFSIAPTLLFYSYIPIIIIALFLSFFIFFKNRYSLQSKLLLMITLSFSVWAFDQIVQWTAIYVSAVHFSWQIIVLFEMLVFIFTLYFTAVFLNKKDINFKYKLLLGAVFLPIVIFLPTNLNINSFDLQQCQSNYGFLWEYIYIFEVSSIVIMMYMFYKKFRSLAKGDSFKKQIVILATGIFLFLGMFTATNILGDSLLVYEFNLIGPIGMVAFVALLAFMIVKFKTFNIKLIATQALVWGLVALIGSQFFFIKVATNFILNGVTFIGIIIFGQFLIKSVKKEIEQKEELAKLNINLEDLLKQRESLVHLVTHKVKGSFTRSKYIFAGILDGTFGDVSSEVKKCAEQGLQSDNVGIQTVDLVLNAANLEKGTVKYEMRTIELKELVEKTILEKKVSAEAKGLKIETEIKNDAYNVIGDAVWLKEVMNNLVENSIKYTREGTIKIGLEKKSAPSAGGKSKILFYVKDTGVGITPEDKKDLFTEGGRGKESVKINIDSTGYGLYSVKLIVEAHKGKVWAESEGAGKGSTFWVELNAV